MADDLFDQGYEATVEAASKSGPAGKVVSGVLGGAVAGGVAATAAASGLAIALPVAGVVAGALGSTAVTGGIIAASAAIGSAIPIPGVGTFIGAVVGAIVAVVQFFNNRPSPEFARNLLAVFRTYPNVLREWVNKRETFGIPHDNSVLRSRWGYVAMLREVAGETGPDPFTDESWQREFEAGRVDPAPSEQPPDLAALGVKATLGEALAAKKALAPVFKPFESFFTVQISAKNTTFGPAVVIQRQPKLYVPEGLAELPSEYVRPELFVYGDHVPMFQTTAPAQAISFPPSAEATARADKLRASFTQKWVRGVDLVPLRAVTQPDDAAYGFQVRVDPAASTQQRQEIEAFAAVLSSGWAKGARSVMVVDDPSLMPITTSAMAQVTASFPPSAQVAERAGVLQQRLTELPWVRSVSPVALRSSALPDDGAYGFQVVLDPAATAEQIANTSTIAKLVTGPWTSGANKFVLVSDRGLGQIEDYALPLVAVGAVIMLGFVGWGVYRAGKPEKLNMFDGDLALNDSGVQKHSARYSF